MNNNQNIQLLRAAQYGDLPRALAALKNGANINARDRGLTVRHWAAQEGHLFVVRALLESGARVSVRGTLDDDVKLLHKAIGEQHSRVALLLIKSGADLNAFSHDTQSTPLHTACAYGYLRGVKLLLKYGADTRVKDKNGRTPLYWAGVYGHLKITELVRMRRRKAVTKPNRSSRLMAAQLVVRGHKQSAG